MAPSLSSLLKSMVGGARRRIRPRLFLVPSIPTSGSQMLRIMYANITQTNIVSVYHIASAGSSYIAGKPFGAPSAHWIRTRAGRPLYAITRKDWHPTSYARLPVLVKTHESSTHNKRNGSVASEFDGIILLVRSPTQQVLANAPRWACNGRDKKTSAAACRKDWVRRTCRNATNLRGSINAWASFYSAWSKVRPKPFVFSFDRAVADPHAEFERLFGYLNISGLVDRRRFDAVCREQKRHPVSDWVHACRPNDVKTLHAEMRRMGVGGIAGELGIDL